MITFETILLFFPAALLLAMAPGPDNLFVMMQSARFGKAAGVAVVLGLCTGLLVHTAAVVLGVAALLQESRTAFRILQFAGAAYLLYLAVLSLRASSQPAQVQATALGYGRLYRRGIVMNVTNPKVSIFFLAFLPQFVTPGEVTAQILQLGALFILATVLVFGAVALLAGAFGERLRSPRAVLILNRITAAVFIALAIKLLFSEFS